MRIGKYEITSGPNWQFYAVTLLVIYFSFEKQSVLPIFFWAAFCVLMVPASLGLHRWNKRQERKLAEEFPLDPEIQKKYGGK